MKQYPRKKQRFAAGDCAVKEKMKYTGITDDAEKYIKPSALSKKH